MIEIILISITLTFALINLLVLIYLGGFLVQLRDEQRNFFKDVVDALSETANFSSSDVSSSITAQKNWDEKYEEELNEVIRRSRQESGLTDL